MEIHVFRGDIPASVYQPSLSLLWLFVLFIIVPVFLSLFKKWLKPTRKREKKSYKYFLRESLLTSTEQKFYLVLKKVVGTRFEIQTQVSLIEVFQPQSGRTYLGSRGKIQSKHIDFLLCDPVTLKPVLGIELDDKSHEKEKRKERDKFVNALFSEHQLPLLRVPVKTVYDPQTLAKQIITCLREK